MAAVVALMKQPAQRLSAGYREVLGAGRYDLAAAVGRDDKSVSAQASAVVVISQSGLDVQCAAAGAGELLVVELWQLQIQLPERPHVEQI